MKIDIVEIFTRAAKITWKYKILWIFGILASCGRGSGGNSNSSSRNNSGTGNNPLSPEMMRQLENFGRSIEHWFQNNTWIFFALIVFFLIAIAVQIFFTLVGTAGLMRGVVKAENGAETLQFGELFTESLSYFWRLFGAALVIWLPFIAIFVIVLLAGLIPVLSGRSNAETMSGLAILILISLCCCGFPISIALNLYHLQVKRSIVVENMGIPGALARGWQILSQNVVPLLIIGVVLFIASFIIGLILAIPILLLILPLMSSFIQGRITSWNPFIMVGVFILCYSPVMWVVNGILTTYIESVWTLAYLRVTTPAETAPVFFEANA